MTCARFYPETGEAQGRRTSSCQPSAFSYQPCSAWVSDPAEGATAGLKILKGWDGERVDQGEWIMEGGNRKWDIVEHYQLPDCLIA